MLILWVLTLILINSHKQQTRMLYVYGKHVCLNWCKCETREGCQHLSDICSECSARLSQSCKEVCKQSQAMLSHKALHSPMGMCAITRLMSNTAHIHIDTHVEGRPMFGTAFIAERGRGCVSVNASKHKRGGDGYRTRWEHGDKDVWKEDEGGVYDGR